MAVLSSILSSPVKPWVIDAKSYSAAAASLTLTIPRSPGNLCIAIIYSTGGTGGPTLPTGFTNLATQVYSPGVSCGARICYKFLNGSEAVTLASTSTSANGMTAHVFLVKGAISSRAPTVSTVVNANSTTTIDPGAVTITAPQTQSLVIATAVANDETSITNYPAGFTVEKSVSAVLAANMTSIAMWQSNVCVSSFNPSAFTISTIELVSSYTIAVRGA